MMDKVDWKYISPKRWELVTRVNGKEVSSTPNLKKITKHLEGFKEQKK